MIHFHDNDSRGPGERFSAAVFLLLLVVLLLIPGKVSAAAITTKEGFKLYQGSHRDSAGKLIEEWYQLQCDDYRGTGSELTIPSEYEGSSADWDSVSAAVKGLTVTCSSDPMKAVSELTVQGIPETVEYTGKKIQPAVSVYDGSKKLVSKVDYTASFGKNKKTGTADVVITGKGIYRDSAAKTFIIVPKAVRKLKLTGGKKLIKVKYKKAAGASGYEITWSLKKNKEYAKKPLTGKKTRGVIKKLKSKKTYYVRVRAYKTVGGKKYYGEYTKPLKVKTK